MRGSTGSVSAGAGKRRIGPAWVWGAALSLAVAGTVNAQCAPTEVAEVIPGLDSGGDLFGASVSVSGDTTVIGAYSDNDTVGVDVGSAKVWIRSGNTVTLQQTLLANDRATGDQFGYAVAISGDTIVVGANREDAGGTDAGAAYVFVRTGTIWTQQAKLTASDAAAGDYFGISVGITGNTVIVGATRDDLTAGVDAGSAYIFTRSGTVWTQRAKLTASDASAGDFFGEHVAIGVLGVRQVAVIGAETSGVAGAAYVFDINTITPGSVWAQRARLTASDASANDFFGSAVAISGGTIVVGAFGDDNAGGTDAGAAYVFTANVNGTVWTERAKLLASDRASGDSFGNDAAVFGDSMVIAAFGDDNGRGASAGAAYLFKNVGGNWTQSAKLIGSDLNAGDNFGYGVGLTTDTIVVGARDHSDLFTNAGSAYVYNLPWLAITAQPVAQTVCRTGTAAFATGLDSNGVVIVQWQYMGGPTGVSAWTDIGSGANFDGASYLFNASGTSSSTLHVTRNTSPGWDAAAPAFQFRAHVRNSCDEQDSVAAQLRVCGGDYNCSGSLTVQDIFDFLAGYFGGAPAADFNDSGDTSVQDLFEFLAAYFAGCP